MGRWVDRSPRHTSLNQPPLYRGFFFSLIMNYCVIPEEHDIGFLLLLNYGLNGLKEHQPKDYYRGIELVEEINRQRGIKN